MKTAIEKAIAIAAGCGITVEVILGESENHLCRATAFAGEKKGSCLNMNPLLAIECALSIINKEAEGPTIH